MYRSVYNGAKFKIVKLISMALWRRNFKCMGVAHKYIAWHCAHNYIDMCLVHHWYQSHNQLMSLWFRVWKPTNREYTWVCLVLSRFGCECEGELDMPCLLEPRCDTHKLSFFWIVHPFHFFSVKHTLDVIWLLCTWAINPDRCPTENGTTPGNQQQLTWKTWL